MNIIKKLFKAHDQTIRVNFGGKGNELGGPFVKLKRMAQYFPNYSNDYNIIYSVSGVDFPIDICKKAQRKGIPVVCHVNSCWHPAYAEDWQKRNRFLSTIYNQYADFVVFGSQQAKRGAEMFIGECATDHQFIYNAVDINHFCPAKNKGTKSFTLLAAGYHQFRHRLEPLIRAMPQIMKWIPDIKLIIAGKLQHGEGIWDCGFDTIKSILNEVKFDQVEFIETYTQEQAPEIYRKADVLIHLKHMDWTPNVVAEAMACGLPIIHMGNGGVPEIVRDAGISLNVKDDWHQIHSANISGIVDAVREMYSRSEQLAEKARLIAEEEFDLKIWINKHKAIFQSLLKIRNAK